MKLRIYWFISMLLLMSVLLSACSGGAPATVAPAPTSAPVVEPTQEPEAVEPPPATEASESALDAAFTASLAGMKGYNALKMSAFLEQLAQNPRPFILDVREVSEVEEKGYIEGAVHIPLRELGNNLGLLPSFDTPIVSYCGVGWRCTIAMTALSALGWTDVKALKDGSFGGWVEAGNPVVSGGLPEATALHGSSPGPALALSMDKMFSGIPDGWGVIAADKLDVDLVENPSLILIDVRQAGEIEENGYIESSNRENIPLEDFIKMKAQWPSDKNAPIVVYCGTGHRSTMAMTILWTYGYSNVLSLKGGLGAWAEAGNPVAGGKATDPSAMLDAAFHPFLAGMVKYNTIGLDELNQLLSEEPPPFVLDVREVAEVEEKGYIEGAVNIPLRQLAKHLDLLPSFDTPIVSYCGVGWRCTIAMSALGSLGWTDVRALKGGSYGGWLDGGYPTVAGLPPDAEVLDAARPDATLVAILDQALSAIPDGWGVITPDGLSARLVDDPGLILIDVRQMSEGEEKGVIEAENHMNLPLEEFVALKDQWPAEKDAPIVVYCGTGHRSTMAMTILWSYGYTNVLSMKGGLDSWIGDGYPVAQLAAP